MSILSMMLGSATMASAQGLGGPGFVATSGNLIAARVYDEPTTDAPGTVGRRVTTELMAEESKRTAHYLTAVPFGATFDGGTAFGIGLAYSNTFEPMPVEANVSYRSTDVEGLADNISVTSGGLKLGFLRPQTDAIKLKLAAFGSLKGDDLVHSKAWQAGLAAEQTLPWKFTLGGNLSWGRLDPKNALSKDDVIATLGLSRELLTGVDFSGDYTLYNQVDGDDAWTVSLSYRIVPAVKAQITGGSDETVIFKLFLTWDAVASFAS